MTTFLSAYTLPSYESGKGGRGKDEKERRRNIIYGVVTINFFAVRFSGYYHSAGQCNRCRESIIEWCGTTPRAGEWGMPVDSNIQLQVGGYFPSSQTLNY